MKSGDIYFIVIWAIAGILNLITFFITFNLDKLIIFFISIVIISLTYEKSCLENDNKKLTIELSKKLKRRKQ
jgi:hypothetical protein